MNHQSGLGRLAAISVAAGLGFVLTACAPVMVVQDNPKDGTVVTLDQDQTLRLRLTSQGASAWYLEQGPRSAIRPVTNIEKPAQGAAQELALFDFFAASPGQDQLTFVYREKGAAPSPADERITIKVAVEG